MSREIKFRAWDGKKMLNTASDADKWTKDESWGNDWQIFFELLEEMSTYLELMQYTGLKDKNGVEIFEGDIFRDENGRVWPVEWSTEYAAFIVGNGADALFSNWIDLSTEIVGNIYENPELLK